MPRWVVSTAAAVAIVAAGAFGQPAPTIRGLDHIPIAVLDLDAGAARFRALGFVLKPGRPHANGIRNVHAKFPDGTELELITAPEAVDDLTRKYRAHLSQGDGPAFLAFYTPDGPPVGPRPPYVFFGQRNASPTDRPEHFAHPNGAESFVAVWLAGADLSAERTLLRSSGATFSTRRVFVPEPVVAEIARLEEGEVVLLPSSHQIVGGRRIVGSTLGVRSLEAVRAAAGTVQLRRQAGAPASLFAPPDAANGLWLEFRERAGAAARTSVGRRQTPLSPDPPSRTPRRR
jgi:hypothetical protein